LFNLFKKKMNNIKKTFGIRDLENLSGIKAHTIRIWEKRYGLLNPDRTDTNIRTYSLESLHKLLNITLLYHHGYKISRIASIPENEIARTAREIVLEGSMSHQAINAIKLAMINFDAYLFQRTFNALTLERSFREIFWEILMPFLEELGLLWQTQTLGPAEEHFICNLIKQKLSAHTDRLQLQKSPQNEIVFILFLPENEIHEIGLLYLNYEIMLRGYKTVYLGASMPLEFMSTLYTNFKHLVFLSYFTVSPTRNNLKKYMEDFATHLLTHESSELWMLGRQTKHLSQKELPPYAKAFESIPELVKSLPNPL